MTATKRPETQFYREPNGDYLRVAYGNGGRRLRRGEYMWDALGAALTGSPCTVTMTGVSSGYLRGCRRVRPDEVPTEWRAMLRFDGE